ncbi:hypothetical protein A0H81_02990 [Grifola frondosa]|uniref:Ribonuclease H1 N-terminal domain-containing protein n=1 Tax=Grifola frondosa TaxID=5627 RepID=A0A1C7MNB4_GRIFR|nr:hypothetical protein A0H81_02990 [Grifola frondosa]
MEHNDSLDLISGAMAGTSEFYAVVYGHHTGVYYKWDDVKLEILKFSNNRYKKFHEFREALEFMVRKGGDAEDSPDEERYWASVDPISDEMAASLTDTFINVKAQYEASSPSKPQTTGIPQKTTETPRTPYRPSTTFTSVNSAASSTMSSSPMSEMSFSFENLGFGDSVNKPTPFNRILSPPQITQPSASTTPPPVYRYERELHGIVRTHYDRVDREQVPILTLGYWVNTYLFTHGYSSEAMLIINNTLTRSSSEEEFIGYLAGRGMPVMELHFLWLLFGVADAN